MQFEPKVKLNFDENVTFFEIEKYDDTDLSHLTPEQQKELDNLNMKFLEETVEPRVKQTFSVCPCCMQDFIARNERRRQIMAADPRTYLSDPKSRSSSGPAPPWWFCGHGQRP